MFNNSFSLNEVQGTSDITNFCMILNLASLHSIKGLNLIFQETFLAFSILAFLIKIGKDVVFIKVKNI